MLVEDLGELEGPVIAFGGPYSNLQALEALLVEAEKMGVEPRNIVSTGDLVAYCADAQGVVERIRELGIAVVAGNCEKQLGAGRNDCGCGFEEGSTCSELAVGWYAHADAVLDPDARGWLKTRPDRVVFSHRGKRYGVIHGGVREINAFIWPVTAEETFRQEIADLEAEVGSLDAVIAGHSGISFVRQIGGHVWINAGTIGMPEHNGEASVRYLHLDEEPQIRSLSYDASAASRAMVARGLTQGYHEALETGWWPSEDVLPPALRRQNVGAP